MPGIAVSAPLTSPPVQLSAKTTLRPVAFSRRATWRAAEEMDTVPEVGGQGSEVRNQERLGCEPARSIRLFILNSACQSQNPFLLQSAGEFASARAACPPAGRSLRFRHVLRPVFRGCLKRRDR